jgi:hypothetical protein
MLLISFFSLLQFHQGDTLDYLGIPGLHLAGSQGVIVIAICQALLMVTTLCSIPLSSHKTMANLILHIIVHFDQAQIQLT